MAACQEVIARCLGLEHLNLVKKHMKRRIPYSFSIPAFHNKGVLTVVHPAFQSEVVRGISAMEEQIIASLQTANPTTLPHCRLLSLPAELRIYIWQLAFTYELKLAYDLLTEKGPDVALLQACRQIRSEATEHHDKAHKQYWSTGRFHLEVRRNCLREWQHQYPLGFPPLFQHQIESLHDNDLKHITRLSVTGVGKEETFVFRNGFWDCSGWRWGMSRVPRRAMYQTRGTRLLGIAPLDTRSGLPRTWDGSHFRCPSSDCDIEAAKSMTGWKGLTSKEVAGMAAWYWGVAVRNV